MNMNNFIDSINVGGEVYSIPPTFPEYPNMIEVDLSELGEQEMFPDRFMCPDILSPIFQQFKISPGGDDYELNELVEGVLEIPNSAAPIEGIFKHTSGFNGYINIIHGDKLTKSMLIDSNDLEFEIEDMYVCIITHPIFMSTSQGVGFVIVKVNGKWGFVG